MKTVKTFACYNTSKDVRLASSSGAIFSLLADYVLKLHGIVYGVAMSEDCYSAEFISVSEEKELYRLRGSKYLQAKIGSTFLRVKNDLISGKMVLFTGTGCQVNGLKSFLRKDYDNLVCVDVICHGVSSPELWKDYVSYLESNMGGKLRTVNFRCKDENWANFGMKKKLDDNFKQLTISKENDPYMQMFLRNYSLRPSCYNCFAKKLKKSDLSIGDFWGINSVAPELNDGMGTSLVLIRTDKGQTMFDIISKKMNFKQVSYEDGVKANPVEYISSSRPIERDCFFHDMHLLSFNELSNKYIVPLKYSFITKFIRFVKNIVRKIIYLFSKERISYDYFLGFLFDSKE
ncbi:MAG: Coenzyme F420 hydrogenase/dehydrogenase, beta subunit C-terminal domain [Lachnobacterium sp.]|nr:Coenzyme F420 hydrogenase/dehydrogenase, beta subunit C-terminal domain [Lachnobacterium sp.]